MEQTQSVSARYCRLISILQQMIPEQMEKFAIPGLGIALVERKGLVWAHGFGCTDLSQACPVSADTPFSLQSISKTYTAARVLIAASQGLIGLDEPM